MASRDGSLNNERILVIYSLSESPKAISCLVYVPTAAKKPCLRRPMSEERILVVDDTGFNRILIGKSLAPLNCSVEQAASAAEALKLLSKERFSLVITDLMMPEMDGVEFFREANRAKHVDDHGEIPVPPFILCTAFHDKDVVEQAIKEGFKDIVLKPVDRDRMLEAVKKALAGTVTEITVKLSGDQAVVLTTLSEMVDENPSAVLKVLLGELSIMDFGKEIDSIDKLRNLFHDRFSPKI